MPTRKSVEYEDRSAEYAYAYEQGPARTAGTFKPAFLAPTMVSWYADSMPDHPDNLQIRSKVWIVNGQGEVILGLGRVKMLEAIHRLGSINAAAKHLKMSTRAIWGRIKSTEERLGRPLLVRNVGGTAGGGSQLTDYAVTLIDYFNFLNLNVIQMSDRLFCDTREEKLPET